ncbi:MAG TPA: DNA/RNA helicase domain-containing protein [Candidatus Saccharimonadales bacterium]|nr:DNA/RNA helicase domain-containing protein [Candidatus Saccharimonadales bacterium]
MPSITSYSFTPETFKILRQTELGNDWPVVYLLENGSNIYIGETISAAHRFKQHFDKPERQKLKRAHIIFDEEYNKSATLDIESSLIQFMAADNVFALENSNRGLANHSYFDREKYQAKFEVIWDKLKGIGFAKQDLIQLKNTDLYKYSPYKALTDEQINIVEDIKFNLSGGAHSLYIVNGEPGTGKSVLAVYLAKYLKAFDDTKNLKVALVVPMTSLRKTLKKVFSNVAELSPNMVIGPTEIVGQEYDLLIVDEAHRLRRRVNLSSYQPYDQANKYYGLGKEGTQLDWILRASKSQMLLYDEDQSVVPGDIRSADIKSLQAIHYKLTNQLRILAGSDYIQYIDRLLTLQPLKRPDFGNYELKYFDSVADMVHLIKQRNEEFGLARLVAGYAWSWRTKKPGSYDYDIDLDGLKLKWNSTNNDWVNSKSAIDEVGCIHTVQGYDLNYVGVIIGPEIRYDPVHNTLIVDRSKYMDINGRRSVESDEELNNYIVNIYKTLLTRGIKGTFIHAVDPELATYIKAQLKVQ